MGRWRELKIFTNLEIFQYFYKFQISNLFYVMSAFGESLALFDVRKPAIILSQSLKHYANPSKTAEELSDFDLSQDASGNTLIATCDEGGLSHVYTLDASHSLSLSHTLKNKHTNICFRILFDTPTSLFTAAFDYKLVSWNLEDPSKSQGRSIFELLSKQLGNEALQYNPPFVYSMAHYVTKGGSRQLVAGLGNGMVLRFKKKGMVLEEISGDTRHGDAIQAVVVDQERGMMVTGANDKSIAFHRTGDKQLIEKTVLQLGVTDKINDMVNAQSTSDLILPELLVADVSPVISKYTVRC